MAIKSRRGDIIPQKGKRKAGPRESDPLLPSVSIRTPIFLSCDLNKNLLGT
jgi:hypothetical protein